MHETLAKLLEATRGLVDMLAASPHSTTRESYVRIAQSADKVSAAALEAAGPGEAEEPEEVPAVEEPEEAPAIEEPEEAEVPPVKEESKVVVATVASLPPAASPPKSTTGIVGA